MPPRFTSITIGSAQLLCDGLRIIGSAIMQHPNRTTSVGCVLEMLLWISFTLLVVRMLLLNRQWRKRPAQRPVSIGEASAPMLDVDYNALARLGIAVAVAAALLSVS